MDLIFRFYGLEAGLSCLTDPRFSSSGTQFYGVNTGKSPKAFSIGSLSSAIKISAFLPNDGLFYCRTMLKQVETIRSLVAAAETRRGIDGLYWDVFAASPEVCDRAIRRNVIAAQKMCAEIKVWNRLQPTYWQ